ncbi:MAG: hypothetical protein ACC655_09980 [Rhodothermia bacterium]
MDSVDHRTRSRAGTAFGLAIAFVLGIAFAIAAVRPAGSNIPANSNVAQSDRETGSVVVVERADLRAAMADELPKGYDPTATTNGGRFFAEVVLRLAREAHSRNPDGPPLLIRYQDWFESFLDINGLTHQTAPVGSRLAYEHRQDVLIDYRGRTIVKGSKSGVYPQFAVNVQVSWPRSAQLPDRYSIEDTTSTPKLRVTNQRVIRFRLLDFDDMIVYDEVEGITGRPVSGVLGALFAIIGDGRFVWTRFSIAEDGTQVIYAKAKKGFFSITEIVTVQPNGVARKGLPNDSPEMTALGKRLKEDIELEYGDWAMPDSEMD